MTKASNIDEYISGFLPEIGDILEQVRATISEAAPQAEEVISYSMPAFRLNGMLVFFAAYKNHIGFYPTPSGIKTFKEELSVYKNSKGAVQFPLNKPLPTELITKIVKFRAAENLQKAETRKK